MASKVCRWPKHVHQKVQGCALAFQAVFIRNWARSNAIHHWSHHAASTRLICTSDKSFEDENPALLRVLRVPHKLVEVCWCSLNTQMWSTLVQVAR